MKSIKLILPAMAFVFAIVTAFASDAFLQASARGIRPSDGMCVAGVLVPPPAGKECLTTNTSNRCQVIIQDQGESVLVPAFAHGETCHVEDELFWDNF